MQADVISTHHCTEKDGDKQHCTVDQEGVLVKAASVCICDSRTFCLELQALHFNAHFYYESPLKFLVNKVGYIIHKSD